MLIHVADPERHSRALDAAVALPLERSILRARGADRLDLLHRLSTNATRDLEPLRETTTILTTEKGRILDLVRVVALEEEILLVLSGTDADGVLAWLDRYTIMDDFTAALEHGWSVVGLYGERARQVAASFVESLPDAGGVARGVSGGRELLLLRDARLGGAGGFLFLVEGKPEDLLAELEGRGATRIDRETYEVLRIEAGQPAASAELSGTYNPLEAGLTQFISFTKGCYIGQEVIARLDSYDKVQRHLVGLEIEASAEELAPLEEIELFDDHEGKRIGTLTSAAVPPGRSGTIGLAYVRTEHAVPEAEVRLSPVGGGATFRARISRLPFEQ